MGEASGPNSKKEKIGDLLEVSREDKGEIVAGERLNHRERRFFHKHPDMISRGMAGERSHVRLDSILSKMSHHGLGIDDVDAIWQVLNRRRKDSPH